MKTTVILVLFLTGCVGLTKAPSPVYIIQEEINTLGDGPNYLISGRIVFTNRGKAPIYNVQLQVTFHEAGHIYSVVSKTFQGILKPDEVRIWEFREAATIAAANITITTHSWYGAGPLDNFPLLTGA